MIKSSLIQYYVSLCDGEDIESQIQMEIAMNSMDALRSEFKQFLLSWLELHMPGFSEIVFNGIVVLWITLFALALHFFLQIFLYRSLIRLSNKLWAKLASCSS